MGNFSVFMDGELGVVRSGDSFVMVTCSTIIGPFKVKNAEKVIAVLGSDATDLETIKRIWETN